MKRAVPVLFAVLAVLSCSEQPEAPSDLPSFALSDGAHGGNPHFFFLPPLVPQPSVSGVFDPSAAPTVEICELVGGSCGPVVATFGPGAVDVESDHYHVNWQTGVGSGVFPDRAYRIRVLVGGSELGFRDVDPNAPGPQRVTDEAFYDFRNGRTIPVKFRIEEGALCAGIDFDDVLGECTTGNLEEGILVQIPETGTGVSIPPQNTLTGTIALVIEPCVDAEGEDAVLPLDLPLFGPCFEVRTIPALPGLLDPAATVFLCELDDLEFPSPRVEELLALHKSDALDGSEPVLALPNAPGLCPSEIGLGDSEAGWLGRLASRVGRHLADVFGPRPLYAAGTMLDRGLGGLSTGFSFFQFALPSKMDILEGDGQTAAPGTAVATDPAVLVTDLDDEPVPGATVRFEVITGNGSVTPMSVLTGLDGVARVDEWVLGDPGLNELRAFGRGIADPVTNGPRATFDPFVPIAEPNPFDEIPVQVATGELIFTADACTGFGSVEVDAQLEALWGCAQIDEVFSVQVEPGGPPVPARLRVLNDGLNLYFAVTVDGGPTLPPQAFVRFDFDHDGDAERDAGEDVIWGSGGLDELEILGDGFWGVCEGAAEGLCVERDEEFGGSVDGTPAFAANGTTWTYELSHPLASADAAHDIQVAAGDTIWFAFSFLVEATGGDVVNLPASLAHVAVVIQAAP